MDSQSAFSQANTASRLPISDAAPIYENLLSSFPTAAKFWAQYAEAQIAANNPDATGNIFSRSLMNCPSVPLYQTYLRFIQDANSDNSQLGQELTKKAFEFVLDQVGDDINSGPVWRDYIDFLKSPKANSSVSLLRLVYQRTIAIPNHEMDKLWTEYQSFEKALKNDAEIKNYSPKFSGAKAVYWERNKLVKDIRWDTIAEPPTGSPGEERQWMAWKKLVAFEKQNPQRIDIVSFNRRVQLVFKQCLMYLYHYPDIWYDYAMWLAKNGAVDAAVNVFERALKAVPGSEMLRYAYAELEESRGAINSAKKIYESLVGDGGVSTSPGLAQIQFLKFLRRTEGVEAAKSYFLEAKKSPNCSYNVYVGYANIALCLDKKKELALYVYEDGMKLFMHEPEFVLEYVDFLIGINDDMNARALFGRVLSYVPLENSVEIWNRFVKFEQTYGNLANLLEVEQRRKEALSKLDGPDAPSVSLESSLQDVVSHYSFRNLYPCSAGDLDHLTREKSIAEKLHRKPESSSSMPTAAQPLLTNAAVPGPAKVVYPGTNQVLTTAAVVPNSVPISQKPVAGTLQATAVAGGDPKLQKMLNNAPALADFLAKMPQRVEGPTPDVDVVLSFVLESAIPSDSNSRKRKAIEREEAEDDAIRKRLQMPELPVDIFKMRQLQKTRKTASQTGSASYGSSSCSSGEQTVFTRNTY